MNLLARGLTVPAARLEDPSGNLRGEEADGGHPEGIGPVVGDLAELEMDAACGHPYRVWEVLHGVCFLQ